MKKGDKGEDIKKNLRCLKILTFHSLPLQGKERSLFQSVDVDLVEYRRKIDTKVVRKNVSLPSWLNYEADKAGINVSRVLQRYLLVF